jgi:hypothetical protein
MEIRVPQFRMLPHPSFPNLEAVRFDMARSIRGTYQGYGTPHLAIAELEILGIVPTHGGVDFAFVNGSSNAGHQWQAVALIQRAEPRKHRTPHDQSHETNRHHTLYLMISLPATILSHS